MASVIDLMQKSSPIKVDISVLKYNQKNSA